MSETTSRAIKARYLRKGDRIVMDPDSRAVDILVDTTPAVAIDVVEFKSDNFTYRLPVNSVVEVQRWVGPENTSHYIRLDAFNLWPGAVIAEQDNWDDHSLQVVVKVDRNHDTEQVVVWYRDLHYADMSVAQAPGVAPRTSVIIVGFSDTFRVYGNVVNPDDLGDDNTGNAEVQL